jgi:hypothetical protein
MNLIKLWMEISDSWNDSWPQSDLRRGINSTYKRLVYLSENIGKRLIDETLYLMANSILFWLTKQQKERKEL